VSEVAKLMTDAGLIVITAFISPFRSERESARALFPPGEFLEIFIDTPLAEAERRDPKGPIRQGAPRRAQELHRHRLALRAPRSAEVTIDTTRLTAEAAAAKIVEAMRARGL
jgi:bifunctional enzyme CysN/CysC